MSAVDKKDPAYDRSLVHEFRRCPHGRHSPALQHLLNTFRLNAEKPSYVLVCRQPGREWLLATLGEHRGDPIRILEDQIFHSREEAEWMRFRLRWKAVTGEDPEAY